MKIGLFGGSFDPVHAGHEYVCTTARKELGLDEVWMLVSPQNPLKTNVRADLVDRMIMCLLMAEPHRDWLQVVDETPYYNGQTIHTLDEPAKEFPAYEFVWIMGADNLVHFHEWSRWKEIIDNHAIAIISRPGEGEQANGSVAAQYAASLRTSNAEDLFRAGKGWYKIENELFGASSTEIVERLQRGERNIPNLPRNVEAHIVRQGLYATTAAPQGPQPP